MPSDPITLVRWRDAKTDPPRTLAEKWTDRDGARMHVDMKRWVWMNGEEIGGPQPALWCDPVPPSEDALTLDDLRLALYVLERANSGKRLDAADRLRRAIEAAEKGS